MTIDFDVRGMSCSACAAKIERTVGALDGVTQVSVNLLKNHMTVTCDEAVGAQAVADAVRRAGYEAIPKTDAPARRREASDAAQTEYRAMIRRLWMSAVFAVPLFYLSMGHMMGWPLPPVFLGEANVLIFALTQFLLLLPVMIINGRYYKNGFRALLKGAPTMDSLIAIGSSAAVVYGLYVLYKLAYGYGHGDAASVSALAMELYFESAATILTLITLGKTLEARAKRKTSDAIAKLMGLAPKTATVLRDGAEVTVPVEELAVGDTVVVKAGQTVPVDGTVIEGEGFVDESALTGESVPAGKRVGSTLVGATISRSGYMKMRVDKVGEDTALAQIIRLVDEATASKAPIASLADKVSGVFVPTVITVAVIAATAWAIAGYGAEFALSIGISVLVVSCPCALGLATPTAIMVGMGKGASNGILIKSAPSLERARDVNTVVFDKTGTVTEGHPAVTDATAFEDDALFWRTAASLEAASEHPIASAILQAAKARGVECSAVTAFEQTEGGGIGGKLDGEYCLVGNRRLMEASGVRDARAEAQEAALAADGKTPVFVARNGRMLGVMAVADPIKLSAKQAVADLQSMGIEVVLLTGDHETTARAIARQVGIERVIAQVLPADKEREIRRLQESGKVVAMVGDGINDAPALARADVGIAVGAGTDIAMESADVVLMKSDLGDVPKAIRLSRATVRTVKQNLFWAFLYNTLGIPVAAGALFIPFALKLNPMIAALAMSMSSVFVVSNALRLRFLKIQKTNRKKGENKMEKTLFVSGMMCGHCAARVEAVLTAMDGVEQAQVNLADGSVRVTLTAAVTDEAFAAVIGGAGYELLEVR